MSTAAPVSDPFDEFSFLPAQASELGLERVPSVRRRTFALPDGRTLSAVAWGDEPPVATFLHGAGLNAHTWDSTILALGLPALAIDLPGHGDSSWRDDAAYTGAVLASDVIAGLEAWTDAPQVLVGQSLGGLTGAPVAARRPDLVRALVVVDITPGVRSDGGASQLRDFFAGPADWASRDELVGRALAFGLGGSRPQAERGVFLNSRVREDGRVEWKPHFARLANQALSAPSAPDPAAAAAQQDAALAVAAGGWEDLAAVTAPLTLVRATTGYVTSEEVVEYRERLPSAAIVEVEAGHNVQEYIPAELAALIRGVAETT